MIRKEIKFFVMICGRRFFISKNPTKSKVRLLPLSVKTINELQNNKVNSFHMLHKLK
jgi:hypothetical protein